MSRNLSPDVSGVDCPETVHNIVLIEKEMIMTNSRAELMIALAALRKAAAAIEAILEAPAEDVEKGPARAPRTAEGVRLVRAGVHRAEAARQAGISVRNLRRALAKAGIPLVRPWITNRPSS